MKRTTKERKPCRSKSAQCKDLQGLAQKKAAKFHEGYNDGKKNLQVSAHDEKTCKV